MSDMLQSTRDGDVLILALNRPDVLNAIDAALRAELVAAIRAVNDDTSMRALVITGTGERAFTAGQDLSELAGLDADGAAAWIRSLAGLYDAIRDLDKPSVVALNGLASGAGLQMAAHADLAVGHAGVRMGQPEIDAGLPSVLGAWVMREVMGLGRAQEMSLSARFVDGETAHRFGLIDRLVPQSEVLSRAVEEARRLGAKPPVSMRLTLARNREITCDGWRGAVAAGEDLVRQAFATGEPQRVAQAFLARRRARSS